ncbi:hypothetical protein WK70_00485 [Burkholderia cepacia]|nr:hypothetical protein WK70_00485 [Burkholderia cepacia]
MIVVVFDLDVMAECEATAVAFADKNLAMRSECLAPKAGELLASATVREAMCAKVVVDFVIFYVTLIDTGVVLNLPLRCWGFVVDGLERRTSGGQLSTCRECGDHLFVVENFVCRVAQARAASGNRLRIDGCVADDQLVGILRVLEVEEQSFLLHQPQYKRQVCFLVLNAVTAIDSRFLQAKLHVAEFPIGLQYCTEDVGDRLFLEDPYVLPTVHERDPRTGDCLVSGEAAIRADVLEVRDIAVKVSLVAAGECVGKLQGDRDGLTDQLLEFDVRILRGQCEPGLEQFTQAFLAREFREHEFGPARQRRLDREQPVVL